MDRIVVLDGIHFDETLDDTVGLSAAKIEEIRGYIDAFKIVVLRGFFAKASCERIKNRIFESFLTSEPSNPPIEHGCPNYYRIDDNPPKSAVKRVSQFMSSFYWNRDIAGESQLMKGMSRMRNRVAKLPEHFALNGVESNNYFTYPTVTHYPVGGGRLNKHIDPPSVQYCVAIASLSQRGDDFDKGGLYIEVDSVEYDLDDVLGIGDVYLMNPKTIHGVHDIDSSGTHAPEWKNIRGRWTLFPALIELGTTYGKKQEGLKDLES